MADASPAEWAAAGSLGLSAISLIALGLAFADADSGYFDPRPAVHRATATARRTVAATHQHLIHTSHTLVWTAASARHALTPAAAPIWHAAYGAREMARDLAALVLLLTTTPKGALR